jgi:PiT family inorganic phosphate transporter
VTLRVVLAGVVGAIAWNLTTWLLGLPTSSSHALIGGVLGSATAKAGWDVVLWHGLWEKVLLPSLLSPALGVLIAALLVLVITWALLRAPYGRTTMAFRRLQVLSAGFVALTHGTNDAQKTMGVMALALVAAHPTHAFHVPDWVIASAAAAMALGTHVGGWRIIRTLGQRITKLEPHQGFAAETAAAAILWTTAHFGFPVSTTHTISGSVLGAGAVRRFSAVRWGIAGNILIAWVLTIPAAGSVAALMELITRAPGGTTIVFVLGAAMALGAFALAAGIRLHRPEIAEAQAPLSPPPVGRKDETETEVEGRTAA